MFKDTIQTMMNAKFEPQIFPKNKREISGIEGKVIKSGKVYELIFTKCGCPLYTQTGIKSTNLCECSRQSMICVFKNLFPQRTLKIECMESILAGNEKCCHRIMFVE